MRTLAFALLASACAAERLPSFNFNVKSNNLGKPSLETIRAECQIESQLTNGVAVGTSVDFAETGKDRFRNVYARISDVVLGRNCKSNLNFDLIDQSTKGTVEIGPALPEGPSVKAKFNSRSPEFVESVSVTTRGKGWRITPTLFTKDLELDLEAETALGPATSAVFGMDKSGKASVDVFHSLGDATKLHVATSSGAADLKVNIAQKIGAKDTLRASVDVLEKTGSADWDHEFESNTVTASVDHATKQVGLSLSGRTNGDWAAKISAPWEEPKNAQITIGRRLSLGAMRGLKFGRFGPKVSA